MKHKRAPEHDVLFWRVVGLGRVSIAGKHASLVRSWQGNRKFTTSMAAPSGQFRVPVFCADRHAQGLACKQGKVGHDRPVTTCSSRPE